MRGRANPLPPEIHAFLAGHGYERRFEEISQIDDWYVLTE